MQRIDTNTPALKELLAKNGMTVEPFFVTPLEYAETFAEAHRQHPTESPDGLNLRTAFRLAAKRAQKSNVQAETVAQLIAVNLSLQGVNLKAEAGNRLLDGQQRELRKLGKILLAIAGLLALLCLLSLRAQAQVDGLRMLNSSDATVKQWMAGIAKLKCGAGLICTLSGGVVTLAPVGGAATTTANYIFAGPTSGAAAAPAFRALVSADIPNNAANTSGTASNLSGTPALPDGTMATTQAAQDNSTKLATTAYVDTQTLEITTSGQGAMWGLGVYEMNSSQPVSATDVPTTANARAWQFVLVGRQKITKIILDVTTAETGKSAYIGIMNAAGDSLLVNSEAMSLTGTAPFQVVATLNPTVTLNPGVYWLIYSGDSVGTARVTCFANNSDTQLRRMAVAEGTVRIGTIVAGAAGALPTSLGTVTDSARVSPLVLFAP